MYSFLEPIVYFLSPLLTFFYEGLQDWGLAIVFFTIFIRLVMFPLSLRTARQQILQTKLQPKLKELREKYGKDQKALMQETLNIYQKYGVRPLAMFSTMLLQMPILMGMYALFMTHGLTMSSIFVPWVVNFAQNDSLHVFPILAAALTFFTNLIPLTSDIISTTLGQRVGVSVIIVSLFLVFLWKAPIALGLYWTTSSLFTLLERIFFHTQVGRALLFRKTYA
jgi:YidC/Oxa1 family membrane protein insertase